MKKIKNVIAAVALFASVFVAGVQSAQAFGPFRFGVKAGVAINELKFNEDAFSASNRAGFTGGITAQFVAPIINIGVDGSVMYVHRQNRINFTEETTNSTMGITTNADYIEVPINFRWNIGLPLVGKFVTPYLATGPDFSFLLSKKNMKNAWENKTFDFAWNFGLGLRLVDRVEIGATYGLGITNATKSDALYGGNLTDGKNRVWTVTAAYLF